MDETIKIPSLDALPVIGIENDLQTVIQARQKLKASFIMVGQILAAPSGVPAELKIKLTNARFHLTTALSAIDTYLYLGHPPTDQAGEVTNLMTCIKNHIQELRAARPAWNNWLKTENPPEAPAPLPPQSAIDPVAAAQAIDKATQPKSALESMSKPTPLRTYLTIGGLALAALVVWKIAD